MECGVDLRLHEDSSWHSVILHQDHKLFEMLLESSINFNELDSIGATPLIWAVLYFESDFVVRLITAGADINLATSEGTTPLMHASRQFWLPGVNILLSCGAAVDIKNSSDNDALLEICLNKNFVEGKAKSDLSGPWLTFATDYYQAACCQALIDAGADIFSKRNDGETMLGFAAAFGAKKVLEKMFEAGCSVDFLCDNHDNQSLLLAAGNNYDSCVALLLELDANYAAQNRYGLNALHASVKNISGYATYSVLLAQGDDIDYQNHNGKNALFHASAFGNSLACQLLIERGASLNMIDNDGRTALMYAAIMSTDCCALLLRAGANPDIIHQQLGVTALMLAVQKHEVASAKLLTLFCSKASLEVQTVAQKRTALMMAAEQGLIDCVQDLVAAGADIERQDSLGLTAMDIAARFGHEAVAACLKQRSALRYSESGNNHGLSHEITQDDEQAAADNICAQITRCRIL